MNSKEQFIIQMKSRTKKFAVDVINFCETLENRKASSVIIYQLIKSATSTGANYRAACRGRSDREFYSKVCIVVEEVDESEYWLEVIKDAKLSNSQEEGNRLLIEANELTRIMSKTKDTMYKRLNH